MIAGAQQRVQWRHHRSRGDVDAREPRARHVAAPMYIYIYVYTHICAYRERERFICIERERDYVMVYCNTTCHIIV